MILFVALLDSFPYRLKRLFYGKSSQVSSKDMTKPVEILTESETAAEGLYVERIRIEKLSLRFQNCNL